MSIFDKAGPLGEKIRGQSNDIFKNLENAAPQLEDLAARGTSLIKSIFGLGGGSGESLNYPLDVEGNPAYNATVSFQVVEFRSAVPGKSQKSHLKQVDDNLIAQLTAPVRWTQTMQNMISKAGEIIDLGVAEGFVEKSGSWYSFNGNRIGQGRENAKKFLLDNKEIADEIEGMIRKKNSTSEEEQEQLEEEKSLEEEN